LGIEWARPVVELVELAKKQGLLVLTAGANTLRLLPPLNISQVELELGIEKLLTAIDIWLD